MTSRIRAWLEDLGDQFWLRPALVVLLCLGLAYGAITIDRSSFSGHDFAAVAWIYGGGADGARSLLSSIASSAIGVAGTIFSITIAALSLASNTMGPRLLRNFVRDARNQVSLGIFLGTFAYALVVLRTIRTVREQAFVPSLAVTGALALAFVCIATLVWYVHHIAASINVERVIDTVHHDLCDAILDLTREAADMLRPDQPAAGLPVVVAGSQYVQALDTNGLADWASAKNVVVHLRVRPGSYVPFGAPIAVVSAGVEGAAEAFEHALAFGSKPAALQDIEYSVRQLNEIAVRALSPGINDPFSAASVIDRFGDALCRVAPRHLPSGALARAGKVVLVHPVTTYDGLCDAMFHTIRQNAAGSAFVLIRLLETLGRVAEVERLATRLATLRRHGDLAMASGAKGLTDRDGLDDLEGSYRILEERLALGGAAHAL